MIMPDKSIILDYSILNCGALVLRELSTPKTISLLWDKLRPLESIGSYDKLLLTLDYLYAIDAISMKNGLIVRCKNDSLSH